jgi:hypothetical protein
VSADVGVDRAVFRQWLAWLDTGQPGRVAADLSKLLADTAQLESGGLAKDRVPEGAGFRGPDRPTGGARPDGPSVSAQPDISTR